MATDGQDLRLGKVASPVLTRSHTGRSHTSFFDWPFYPQSVHRQLCAKSLSALKRALRILILTSLQVEEDQE